MTHVLALNSMIDNYLQYKCLQQCSHVTTKLSKSVEHKVDGYRY